MSAYVLLAALRNERVIRKKPFSDQGFFPGPEPVVELPSRSVLRDGDRLLIGMDDLIELVRSVLRKEA